MPRLLIESLETEDISSSTRRKRPSCSPPTPVRLVLGEAMTGQLISQDKRLAFPSPRLCGERGWGEGLFFCPLAPHGSFCEVHQRRPQGSRFGLRSLSNSNKRRASIVARSLHMANHGKNLSTVRDQRTFDGDRTSYGAAAINADLNAKKQTDRRQFAIATAFATTFSITESLRQSSVLFVPMV
jgi:hypothetical protein